MIVALRQSPHLKLGIGGWLFFIAENALLSENRTFLIEKLGDDNYHLLYGTFSTCATGAIGYSYYKLTKIAGPLASKTPLPAGSIAVAWGLTSVGLVMASQALPKMQVPLALTGNGGFKVQVRCPFDFSDKALGTDEKVTGMDRVSRHPGLWSFGLAAAGNAPLQAHPALRLWWYGPAAVAFLGGMHSDSRFRRGMGGVLDPFRESQTSNVPFVAILTGKQGSPSNAMYDLVAETKPLNAAVAVGIATLWVASRRRAQVQRLL